MARHAPAALLAVLTICGTLGGVARPLAQGAAQSAPIPYGKTKLGLIKPVQMLSSLSQDPALATVAKEVEDKTLLMVNEAK